MAQALVALIVSLCLALPAVAAQVKTDTKKPLRPAWSELKPEQQKILAPLASEWDRMAKSRSPGGERRKAQPDEQDLRSIRLKRDDQSTEGNDASKCRNRQAE